ncbi:MAG: hypothetical protein J5865_08000 [Lachnospiraceae bacterium]|nr:hypothetical protein [Lachnospiraceae bacterium]
MKEKIGRLSRGIIETKKNRIVLEPERIETTVSDDAPYQGEFSIKSKNRLAFRGIVYSSDPHVVLNKMYFAGTDTLITYQVTVDETLASDTIDGAFSIVSSSGEFSLPFHFTVSNEADREGAPVTTLKDFAEYAASEPERALSFFTSDDFIKLPFMQTMEMQTLYSALIADTDKRAAMEEFLIAKKMKEPVTLSALNKELTFLEAPQGVQVIRLNRSGEGYLRRVVSQEGDFLRLDTRVITDEDFSGDLYNLRFAVDRSRLKEAVNTGRIILTGVRGEETFTIHVHAQELPPRETNEKKHMLADYTAEHLKILMDPDDLQAAQEMHRIAEAMYSSGRATLRDLLRKIEALHYVGRDEEAAEMLENLSGGIRNYVKRDPEAFAYFYYLVCLVDDSEEKRDKLLELVSKYETVNAAAPALYLIRAGMDPELIADPERTLEGLYRLYDQGVDSPYLYNSAMKLYLQDPALIRVLDAFEMQVLIYGARRGLLTLELARETALLTRQTTEFSDMLYQLLVLIYQQFPEAEILTALCALLIKAGKKEEKYFPWYQEAVERDLRIAALYDYYLTSMPSDFDDQFPSEVYLYYSYNSPSDQHAKELLYRSVLTYYGKGTPIYEAYEKQISDFAAEQLLKGRIDRNLAVIYRDFLTPEIIDENMAKLLPDLLKTCRIEVDDPAFSRIVIYYGELNGEQSMDLTDGAALLPLYTDRYIVLFEDRTGNRYTGIPYRKTVLMQENEKLVQRCELLLPDRPLSKLKDIESCLGEQSLSKDQMELLTEMSRVPGLSPYYKKMMISAVINHHDWREVDDCGDLLIDCMESEFLPADDKVSLIQALGYQGRYEEGWRLTRESSYVNLPLADLLELCIYSIKKLNFAQDDFVLEIDKYLFKHKTYDSTTLAYLCRHYNGLSRDMLKVLKAAVKAHASTEDMTERLLAQMLFTGAGYGLDTVFKDYVKTGKVERILVDAYYVTKCYNYFVKNEPLPEDLAKRLTKDLQKNAVYYAIPVITMLAVTKYWSMQETVPEEFCPLLEAMVRALVQKNIVFTHYKRLAAWMDIPQEICDKTIVTYRGEEGLTVVLMLYRNGTSKDPIYLEMNHAYGGIYTRPVLLFNDDHPRYEIRVEKNGVTKVVEVGELYPDITRTKDELKFTRLDRLLELHDMSDEEDWQEDLRAYGRNDTLYGDLFTIQEG